jgi:hypothetical protein
MPSAEFSVADSPENSGLPTALIEMRQGIAITSPSCCTCAPAMLAKPRF